MLVLRTPDLNSPRRIAAAVLIATVAVALVQIAQFGASLGTSLGDTDDALRLAMVRDLVAGRGWFDTHLTRLQPPFGLDMHWSRLVDGGLAALEGLFALVLAPAAAETAMRLAWPLLWIVPAAASVVLVARRLGGNPAAVLCALLLVTDPALYIQFRPGRIDHHNIQIVLTLVAVAAMLHAPASRRAAWIAGAATGLLLGIGLEALDFAVMVGAVIAVRFGIDAGEGRDLRGYAFGLGASTAAVFLLQTPPARLGVVACDALALNLVAGLLVMSAGLALVARPAVLARSLATPGRRFAALGLVGAVTGTVYLAMDPSCAAGPFGGTEPRLWPIWLDHVQELQSLRRLFAEDATGGATFGVALVMALVCLAVAWRDPARRRDPAWIACGVLLIVATLHGVMMVRALSYALWIGLPVMAATIATAWPSVRRGLLVPTLAASLASPTLVAALALQILPADVRAATSNPGPFACLDTAAYADLARQPPGLVLGDIDLGSFVVANTPHSVLAAPYHRMGQGITTAVDLLRSPPEQAREGIAARHVDYVVTCTGFTDLAQHTTAPAGSLLRGLDAGRVPAWLEPLAGAGPLRAYRVVDRTN